MMRDTVSSYTITRSESLPGHPGTHFDETSVAVSLCEARARVGMLPMNSRHVTGGKVTATIAAWIKPAVLGEAELTSALVGTYEPSDPQGCIHDGTYWQLMQPELSTEDRRA